MEQEKQCLSRDYCVAIRTLGTAGEKYQTLLNSLKAQTIQPKHIFVYIAEGYDLPKETIGIEEYIRTQKGMITQRSLPFEEIDTEYILFCDDDMFLPPDLVEKMFEGIITFNADIMGVNVFEQYKMTNFEKLSVFIHSFISPRKNDGWNIKIKRNGSFSYNNNPIEVFLPTESTPGACCLCKKTTYEAIHFDDERWLENMSYPAGEDQLFFYKSHIMGYQIYQYQNSGVVHLDAQAGNRSKQKNKMYLQKMNMFIMWYRTIFSIHSKSVWEKCRCILALSWRCVFGIITLPLEVIHYKQPHFFIDYFRGLWAGYKYVHSKQYRQIPPFDAYIKK